MKRKTTMAGFSLLEALMAVVVISVAGLGVYSLFNSGLSNSNLADTEDEMIELANVYTDLASSDLTSTITTGDGLASVLQRSGRLSNKYFVATTSESETVTNMLTPYGALVFSNVSPYSFTVCVPLGSSSAKTSTIPNQFCQKMQDVYSCPTNIVGACAVSEGQLVASLTYNLNS